MWMQKSKDLVVGLGEIGNPILMLLSKATLVTGYDVQKDLVDEIHFQKLMYLPTNFMHVCIPFNANFNSNVIILFKKFKPKCIVIHSTIKPGTTEKLQKKLPIPIIYSATRGVHRRMLSDLKRYVKFYAVGKNAPKKEWAANAYSLTMKKCGVVTKRMSSPITLELAKIVCDTSYYGWLITYSQISNLIARENNVDYDEMWSFADEIHKFLGNRPKMFPGFIGGHCVVPNLELIDNQTLNMINKFNLKYAKTLKQQ